MDPDSRRIAVRHLLGLDEGGSTKSFRVQLDGPVNDEIERTGGQIVVDLRHSQYPQIEWWSSGTRLLYVFAWRFMRPNEKVKSGHLLHHWDEDKMNNTVENLISVSRRTHARHHFRRRQKFSRRPREDLGSLYRHRPPRTVPVSATREEILHASARLPLRKSPREETDSIRREAKAILDDRWYSLFSAMPGLFRNGRLDVPQDLDPRWHTGRTRALGIKPPRLRLSRVEEVLVILILQKGFDRDAVAAETGIAPEWLRQFYKSVGVANALQHLTGRWKILSANPLLRIKGE